MAIKFKTLEKRKIVNRCIMCGKTIPMSKAICTSCNNKRVQALKRKK